MFSIKDNAYLAINGEWIKNAKIEEGKSQKNAFSEIAHATDEKLREDISKLEVAEDPAMNEFLKLYKMSLDENKKNKDGVEPLKRYIDFILELENFDDMNKKMHQLMLNDIVLPFNIGVGEDMGDATRHTLYVGVPSTILPNKEYYSFDNKDELLGIYRSMSEELLAFFFDENMSKKLVDDAIKYDAIIVNYVKSSEENADFTKIYNPRKKNDLKEYSKYIDLVGSIDTILAHKLDDLIITEPRYFDNFDVIVNPDTFEMMKSWMLVNLVIGASNKLTEETRIIGGKFARALSGIEKPLDRVKYYYDLTTSVFSEVVGIYYANKYFGEDSKKDVEHMVKNFIMVYKERLLKNEWLQEVTKQKAVEKLDKLGILIGYPEKYDSVYSKFKIKEGYSFYENIMNIHRIKLLDEFKKYGTKTDRTEWSMSANTVNAYYNPLKNIICFPAAILQEPFYSLKQSKAKNYGAIGAVIAHEISHAFDNNGSQFDSNGNINNWWTPEDYAKFNELVEKMIKQFDGIELDFGKVNGTLTVSENIADNGGLNCALQALKMEKEYDLKEFFTSWITIWRQKATTEYKKMLLSTDVHGPNELRANMQVKNIEEFYEVFEVGPNDEMYLEKDKRLIIW